MTASGEPTITICTDHSGGVHIYFNEDGRALFIDAQQELDSGNDHFHLSPDPLIGDVLTRDAPQRPDQTSHAWGKVYLVRNQEPN